MQLPRPPLSGARRLCCALAPPAVALIIGACGASSPAATSPPAKSGGTTPSKAPARTPGSTTSELAFSKCVRSHGVPGFPDLSSNGMRIGASGRTISVNGVAVSAPAFAAARQKCQQYMPHVHGTPAQAAQQRQLGLRFARCMRSHGVPTFPDPKAVGGSGGNQAVYLPGVTNGELQAPAFKAAAKACGGGPKGP